MKCEKPWLFKKFIMYNTSVKKQDRGTIKVWNEGGTIESTSMELFIICSLSRESMCVIFFVVVV